VDNAVQHIAPHSVHYLAYKPPRIRIGLTRQGVLSMIGSD